MRKSQAYRARTGRHGMLSVASRPDESSCHGRCSLHSAVCDRNPSRPTVAKWRARSLAGKQETALMLGGELKERRIVVGAVSRTHRSAHRGG